MGILNFTLIHFLIADNFFSWIKHLSKLKMLKAGASIIDIGGESTRPNAAEVIEQELIVLPLVEAVRNVLIVGFLRYL